MPPQSSSVPRNSYEATSAMDQKAKRSPKPDHRVRSNDRSFDQQSIGSGSAPNSVYLACTPMTRELSDLSGSYLNGTANRGSKDAVPGHIYDHSAYKGPWRQAYNLSQVPPSHKENWAFKTSSADATILVSQNDVVEIIDTLQLKGGINASQLGSHNRIPVIVLLMDVQTHSYELMQVWVDRSSDSVRDLVQCLRQSIPDTWRQDYDGVFQVRGNRFTQLIHILRLLKYDIQPNEILIAKPMSMTAKVTISCATSAIRHLTNIGMINTDGNDRVFRPKSEESPLLLSTAAQDRVYAPDGSFSHHHAVSFLTFSPPFDPNVRPIDFAAERDCANSSIGSQSAASEGRVAKGSVLSALGLSGKTNSVAQAPPEDCSDSKNNQSIPQANATDNNSALAYTSNHSNTSQQGRRCKFSGMVSKLKCCKPKERLLVSQPRNTVVSLTEEQEHQWSSFDVRSIADDQFSGQSVVSMSAPLLTTQQYRMQASEYFSEF